MTCTTALIVLNGTTLWDTYLPMQALYSLVHTPLVWQYLNIARELVLLKLYPLGHSKLHLESNLISCWMHSGGFTWLRDIELSLGHLTAVTREEKTLLWGLKVSSNAWALLTRLAVLHMSSACPRGWPQVYQGDTVCQGIQRDGMGSLPLGRGKFKGLFQNQWIGVGEFATLLNHGRQPRGYHRNIYHLHGGRKRSQAMLSEEVWSSFYYEVSGFSHFSVVGSVFHCTESRGHIFKQGALMFPFATPDYHPELSGVDPWGKPTTCA